MNQFDKGDFVKLDKPGSYFHDRTFEYVRSSTISEGDVVVRPLNGIFVFSFPEKYLKKVDLVKED